MPFAVDVDHFIHDSFFHLYSVLVHRNHLLHIYQFKIQVNHGILNDKKTIGKNKSSADGPKSPQFS